MGDRVGKAGIEAEYDRFLRGRNGAARVEVDALGNLTETLKREQPVQGKQLRLSLDLDVQRVAQQALAGGTGKGAFAVMNVQNGEVLALGSQPSFDPNVFTKPITKKQLDALTSKDLGEPLLNRAIQAGYPTGSTFKLVTAVGRARERAHHAGHAAERPGLAHRRRRQVRERRRRRARRARAGAGAHGLERRVLLPARARHERGGHAAPGLGAPARHRPAGPASTCPPRSPAACRRRRGATAGTSRSSPTAHGPWATTSTSRWARATCSRTRSRWPSRTRRSRTAAACCGRASACGSRTRAAARSSSSTRPRRAA